jgi:integrase/recombinase XerD
MERTNASVAALIGRAAGPLASHLGQFVTWLIDQQYTASVIYVKARHAVAFDRWLAKRRVVVTDLGEAHIERYQRRSRRGQRCIRTETRRGETRELTQLLRFLRDRGVCQAAHVETTAAGDMAASYGQHLQHQQGLATATIERYRTVARLFLHELFDRDAVDLRALCADDAIAFAQRQAKRLQPPALKCVVSALRSFLRYAQYRGEVTTAVAAAVPTVAAWATTPSLPKAISPEHAQRAIDSCDLSIGIGLRDRAVLLLLARIGLRAHEVIALRLEDCDWECGHLRVRSKSGREQLLPMLADVGAVIATYLEHGRPVSKDRHLLLAVDGPNPRTGARLRCHRQYRAPRAAACSGRRTAPRITPVPACTGGAHAARGRFVGRDWRSPAPSKPADHLNLRSGGHQCAAFLGPAVAGRCAMKTLREALQNYLALRRGLGFKMRDAGKVLLRFVTFMEEREALHIKTRLALEWVQQAKTVQPAEWARQLCFIRGFARYRSATDPLTEVPSPELLPYRSTRARPYLYTEQEVQGLLDAALQLPTAWPSTPLRPWVFHCLLGLLSVTGLRISEALDLKVDDVDLDQGVLTIRAAKFGRSRLVPLHPSTRTVLVDYLQRRKQFLDRRRSDYVFVSNRGTRLDVGRVHRAFYSLSRQTGLRAPGARNGPRLHDFRHRFAVQVLTRWYELGEDPARRLPVLSTYLGHVYVAGTYWYLSNWPELMAQAMARLERRWGEPS